MARSGRAAKTEKGRDCQEIMRDKAIGKADGSRGRKREREAEEEDKRMTGGSGFVVSEEGRRRGGGRKKGNERGSRRAKINGRQFHRENHVCVSLRRWQGIRRLFTSGIIIPLLLLSSVYSL